jgi:voltage-gated potassium channel
MGLGQEKGGRNVLRQLIAVYRRHRFSILFYSLMLTLGGAPLLKTIGSESNLIETFLGVNLLAAVLSEAVDRGMWWFLPLGVVPILARLIVLATGAEAFLPFSLSLWSIVCLLAVGTTLRHALGAGPVNAERLYAALSAYVLIGVALGVVYWILEQSAPGSLALSSARPVTLERALYFSFVTLATLGYGDIVPISEPASWLAILEAMGGQMYLAVLVARLVSLYAKTQPREASDRFDNPA